MRTRICLERWAYLLNESLFIRQLPDTTLIYETVQTACNPCCRDACVTAPGTACQVEGGIVKQAYSLLNARAHWTVMRTHADCKGGWSASADEFDVTSLFQFDSWKDDVARVYTFSVFLASSTTDKTTLAVWWRLCPIQPSSIPEQDATNAIVQLP